MGWGAKRINPMLDVFEKLEAAERRLVAEKAYSDQLYRELQKASACVTAAEERIEEMAQELLFYRGEE